MDMDPLIPKAVWGFNGTERPGAVYLAAVLAGQSQKGLPAFSIYGRDVQDGGDKSIPEDVQQKVLQFVRSGLAVAIMRGKSYLGMGGGFQGQRQWTDYQPNGDYLEAILNTSFDWNGTRAPYIVATENDCLNGASMLIGYLLTNTAQIFADVRTYWSADAVKRVSGHK